MEAVFLKVLNMSLSASFVILVVLALRLLLCRAPKKWSYALWSVAAFRLCCPWSFAAAFSLFNLQSARRVVSAASLPATELEYIPPNVGMMAQPRVNLVTPELSETVSAALPAATPLSSANPLQIWIFIGAALWCAGMAALLVYCVVSYARLRRRVDGAVSTEDGVYETDRVRAPFILGFLRPRIYIPLGLEGEARDYVLAHERYHIKRRDYLVKAFAFALLTLHWFNPLVWLAFRLMGKDMEMSCDEAVLDTHEGIRKAYSTTLLSFAAGERFPTASPLAFGETGVKTRIKNALRWKKPKTWVTIAAAIVCLGAIAACAANPKSTNPTAGGAAPVPREAARALFASLGDADPASLMLTYAPVDGGTPTRVRAGTSVLAEEYLRLLAEIRWTEAPPQETEDAYLRLEGQDWRLTGYLQTTACACFEAEGQTLWYYAAEIPADAYGRTLRWQGDDYRSALMSWYDSAMAAEANRGSGVPLTAGELFAWRAELASDYTEYDEIWGGNTTYPMLVSCFFTSLYDDPRDLDLAEFLRYCPLAEPVEDEAEFDALNLDWEIEPEDGVRQRMTLDQMPVPTHRYRVSRINEALMQYAGITLDDMSTDWRKTGLYVPEYDAFYNFTSDYGPGVFRPDYGERDGDVVTLYCGSSDWNPGLDGYRVLTLRYLPGGGYHILSHQSTVED